MLVKIIVVVIGLIFCLEDVYAQSNDRPTRYHFISYTFHDEWKTDSMIFKIITYSKDHPPEDNILGDANIYHTKEIAPVDLTKANKSEVYQGILNFFEVFNQYYSMVDLSQMNKLRDDYFFIGNSTKVKYQFDNFSICGIVTVEELKKEGRKKIRYTSKYTKLKIGRLRLKVKPEFFESYAYKYFDAIMDIKVFDENRLVVYP